MKKLFLIIVLFFTVIAVSCQPEKGNMMPVTTKSKAALSYYDMAMKYYDDVKLKEALQNFKKALDEDQDFFMVNYQLAFYFILNRDQDNMERFEDAAINCKAKLSGAEELMKQALVKLRDGDTSTVTELGKKLVDMYPYDPNSYNSLVSFQTLTGDSAGIVETLNKAIKIVSNPAAFYNQLGYAYLTLNQSDKAEAAFDKYIELEPQNPNVYDSKGDFYMYVRRYDRAYESYMKAYSMDPSFSHDKAEMAKQLYEQTEGKSLQIISI